MAPGQLMCFVCAGNAIVAYNQDETTIPIDIAVTMAPWQVNGPIWVTVPVCLFHMPVQKKGSILQVKGSLNGQ